MAIKNNLDKKTQLKKSETEKVIGVIPKTELKKEGKDSSKKENTDVNLLSKFVTQVHSKTIHNCSQSFTQHHQKRSLHEYKWGLLCL
jgi:hypothetical protein